MEANRILQGDALAVLRTLPLGIVNCCVTSPPYFGLRDYGVDGQIGLEETPEAYIARLTEVFREVRRVMASDGTLWIVIADSYAGNGKGRNADGRHKVDGSKSGGYRGQTDGVITKQRTGCKTKDLIGIPWMLAFALRDDGWYLRSDIIWHKPNNMPHSVTDRPVNTYEHLFLLAKSPRYYFDYHALEVPTSEDTKRRVKRGFHPGKYAEGAPGQAPQTINRAIGPTADVPAMRRGRDVWSVPTAPYKGAHFAAYPMELVKPCIMAGCPEGGIVIDPFFGSGTTGAAALELGRRYFGVELNTEYIWLAEERLASMKPPDAPRDVEESARGADFMRGGKHTGKGSIAVEAPMDKEKFWQIIDAARGKAGAWQDMYEPLLESLSKLEAPDIVHWQQIFYEYQTLSYKKKLWAAAAVMHGGCSDDSFDYFRGWLTAQGKEVFLNALADPDSLAGVEAVQAFGRETLALEYTPMNGYYNAARFESMLSVAVAAYENKTGGDLYDVVDQYPLSGQEKADIAGEIVYAADIDAKWGGLDTPWLETDASLKKWLPNLHGTFNEAPVMQKAKEKESVLGKIRESGKQQKPRKPKQNNHDKGGPEL